MQAAGVAHGLGTTLVQCSAQNTAYYEQYSLG